MYCSFTLPRLHKGKQWYVDSFAYDPARDGMRRKKYMLARYKKENDRENLASILIHNLFERLKLGWNPFVNARKTRQFTEFRTVLQRYHDYTVIAEKKGILKPKTAVDYRSRLNQLEIYLHEAVTEIKYIYQFDRAFIVDFLDYLILDKDVSAKIRNNYRTWLSTFSTWLTERLYIDTNPVDDIHMSPFYLACMMEYYCFIRPDELRSVKIGDISICHKKCYLMNYITKIAFTRKIGKYAFLSIYQYLLGLALFQAPNERTVNLR